VGYDSFGGLGEDPMGDSCVYDALNVRFWYADFGCDVRKRRFAVKREG
jgi:hypothetical protein